MDLVQSVLIKKVELKLLYLDDEKTDLDNFSVNVNKYNIDDGNMYSDSVSIRVKTILENIEAEPVLKSDAYQVFICDHNMPEMKGLDFITKFLKTEFPNILYVLYTGAGNLNDDVKSICVRHDILFFEKSEEFSTLIEKIINKLSFKKNPMDALFTTIANDIISDMKQVEREDPSFLITIADKGYNASEIIREIKNKTPIGIEYLIAYVDGLKFFNKK